MLCRERPWRWMWCLLLAVTVLTPIAGARDIYVATNGSDITGNGSEANPYRTIGKGIQVSTNGDVVLVKAGTYSGSGHRNPIHTNNGSETNPAVSERGFHVGQSSRVNGREV